MRLVVFILGLVSRMCEGGCESARIFCVLVVTKVRAAFYLLLLFSTFSFLLYCLLVIICTFVFSLSMAWCVRSFALCKKGKYASHSLTGRGCLLDSDNWPVLFVCCILISSQIFIY